MTSCLKSKLVVITSVHEGSGDLSETVSIIDGVGSARLHLRPLFRTATELNLNPRLLSLDIDSPTILNELGQPEICVIAKINHFDDTRVAGFAMATLAAVARLKARNTKIVLLYCDHLAPLACSRGSLYCDLLLVSDHIIVPSQAMADRAKKFLTKLTPITVIKDPWQVKLQPYQMTNLKKATRIAWFGNANNIFFLRDQLFDLMRTVSAATSVELVILSNTFALNTAKEAFDKFRPSALRPWSLELIEWDESRQPAQLEQVLGSAHISWLPSDPKSLIKGGISHNRLVDSVRSGSVVVASNMQSYEELSRLALLGSDHGSLINQLIPHYERLAEKYTSLRSSLLEQFSPERNRDSWKQFFNEILDG